MLNKSWYEITVIVEWGIFFNGMFAAWWGRVWGVVARLITCGKVSELCEGTQG